MTEYAIAAVDWEQKGRLENVAGALDPTTIGMLDGLGVAAGWRCAEIGAGAGTIAAWLHERVGPDGHVLATDLEPRWLELLELPGLEVRRHDIVAESLGEDLYDLVHCRWVLCHVGDWRKALGRMVASLRPGGWLLVEDTDWSSAGVSYPPCEAMDRLWEAFSALMRGAGGELYLGRQLVAACRELGLLDIEARAAAVLGGIRSDLAAIGGPMIPLVVEAGLVSAEVAEEGLAFLQDPANFSIGLLNVGIQARKPG